MRIDIRTQSFLLVLAALLCGACGGQPEVKPEATAETTPRASAEVQPAGEAAVTPEARAEAAGRSAEDVVRSFFLAMMTNDEAGVRSEIVAHPDAAALWQGQSPPPEALPRVKAQLAGMTCRECTVGEVLDLPGGARLEVTDEMVGDGKKLMVPMMGGVAMPTPLPVVKIDGEWKVDARSLIAARVAAKRARGE